MAKGGSLKGDAPAQIIHLDDEERSEWVKKLSEYYATFFPEKFKTDKSKIDHIHKCIRESEAGWNRAPRDFPTRILKKTGYGKKNGVVKVNFSNTCENKKKIKDEFEYDSVMTVTEMAWWRERKKAYEEDFEFNTSSDNALIEKLLVEEMVSRRLSILQLANPQDLNISRLANEAQKRVNDIQTKLGITREQRADEISSKSGDISTFALLLDEKKKNIAKIQAEEIAEEKKYQEIKNRKPPVNILPPMEKVIATLGIESDGNIRAITDELDVTKDLEAMHKEVMEDNGAKITEHEIKTESTTD